MSSTRGCSLQCCCHCCLSLSLTIVSQIITKSIRWAPSLCSGQISQNLVLGNFHPAVPCRILSVEFRYNQWQGVFGNGPRKSIKLIHSFGKCLGNDAVRNDRTYLTAKFCCSGKELGWAKTPVASLFVNAINSRIPFRNSTWNEGHANQRQSHDSNCIY